MSGNFKFERQCYALGYQAIAGVDEVGMGCLAGPVVAAAVILVKDKAPKGIDDSKKLSAKKREQLDAQIRESAVSFSIALATVEEIDTINIFHAAKLAMNRAIEALNPKADYLLIDGRHPLKSPLPQQAIVKGDQQSVSIGAASILAKVFRDRMMQEFDGVYPGYEFASHKGYGSTTHRKALQTLGRSPIHRKTFSWTPV